ncbi:MAG: hypothetical protein ACXVXJ_00030 [Mycobacteriaceae bacterium]
MKDLHRMAMRSTAWNLPLGDAHGEVIAIALGAPTTRDVSAAAWPESTELVRELRRLHAERTP